jgi:hypothetical protein
MMTYTKFNIYAWNSLQFSTTLFTVTSVPLFIIKVQTFACQLLGKKEIRKRKQKIKKIKKEKREKRQEKRKKKKEKGFRGGTVLPREV